VCGRRPVPRRSGTRISPTCCCTLPRCERRSSRCRHADAQLGALRGRVDYVISGLPILWFSRETKAAILSEAFELLKPDGRFQQFTYLGRPPVGPKLLAELGLQPTLLGIAPMNLPPAFVYRFTRR
jgi:phospholipid N-methyltransferase